MNGFVFHPEAEADLADIWEYIATDNLTAADRVIEEIYNKIQALVAFPHQGHSRADLSSRPLRFQLVRYYFDCLCSRRKAASGDCRAAWPSQPSCDCGHTSEKKLTPSLRD
jgi:plasmid stabilization system protein ParE